MPKFKRNSGAESVILSEFLLSCFKLTHFAISVSKSTCVLNFSFAARKVPAQNSFCWVWMTERNLHCYYTGITLPLLDSSLSTRTLFTRGGKYHSFEHSCHLTVVQKHWKKKTGNHISLELFVVENWISLERHNGEVLYVITYLILSLLLQCMGKENSDF